MRYASGTYILCVVFSYVGKNEDGEECNPFHHSALLPCNLEDVAMPDCQIVSFEHMYLLFMFLTVSIPWLMCAILVPCTLTISSGMSRVCSMTSLDW